MISITDPLWVLRWFPHTTLSIPDVAQQHHLRDGVFVTVSLCDGRGLDVHCLKCSSIPLPLPLSRLLSSICSQCPLWSMRSCDDINECITVRRPRCSLVFLCRALFQRWPMTQSSARNLMYEALPGGCRSPAFCHLIYPPGYPPDLRRVPICEMTKWHDGKSMTHFRRLCCSLCELVDDLQCDAFCVVVCVVCVCVVGDCCIFSVVRWLIIIMCGNPMIII